MASTEAVISSSLPSPQTTNPVQTATTTGAEKHHNGVGPQDHAGQHRNAYNHGGNPLAHIATNDSSYVNPAFGGQFQPGLYRTPKSRFGNPAPLGLSAFALTTFVLSLINMRAKNVNEPNLVVAVALGYGGLVQLLAGMW